MLKGLFKSFKNQLMGSVKADLNSALEGQRNMFNANISDALDDLFAAKFGVNISNVPSSITSHADKMKERNAVNRKLQMGAVDTGVNPEKITRVQFPTDQEQSFVNNFLIIRTMKQVGAKVANRDGYEIALPLPKIQDDIAVSYKTEEIGLGAAATQSVMDADYQGVGGTNEGGRSFSDTFIDVVTGGGKELGRGVLEALAPLTPIAEGEVQNPVKFQLFEGVGFRNHSYSFDLHPFNQQDSDAIAQIIYILKLCSLPTVDSQSPRRFHIPYTFELDYFGPISKQLEKPLPSGLTKVGVDYSGGSDMTFIGQPEQAEEGGNFASGLYPNGITLSVEFTELITMDSERYQKFVSVHRDSRMDSMMGAMNRDARMIKDNPTSDEETIGQDNKLIGGWTEPTDAEMADGFPDESRFDSMDNEGPTDAELNGGG